MAKKTVYVNGNVVSFTMGLKRDNLNAPDHTIQVEIDVTGVAVTELLKMVFSGQSARVKLQTRLRKKTEEVLYKLEKSTYKTTWTRLFDEEAESYASIVETLSREDFVQRVVTDFGCDVATAERLYESKHASD